MNIHISSLLRYYKQRGVQEAIVACAKDKEIAVKFGDKGFGKRPDVLMHPSDVLEFVKRGATSFHCSEELWHNPLQIVTGSKRSELDKLRKGWDLMLDIDCNELEYSKIAADLLIHALEYHGIKSVSVKFSGNHGFHIAVPFKSFPRMIHNIPSKKWFPEGPRQVALYLQEMIRPHLAKRILKTEEISDIMKKTGVEKEKILKNNKFDPFGMLDIDTVLIASRHLYRMPYSFNEKSGLVSVPIGSDKIMDFDREQAKWQNVKPDMRFLAGDAFIPNEARQLLIQAFDFSVKEDRPQIKTKVQNFDDSVPQQALSENLFPPCIKNILDGLIDGKKRSSFLLLNFLRTVGWDYDKIEELLMKWNENNAKKSEELRETILLGQLRYHKQAQKRVLPPNCDNPAYYKSFGVCKPDPLCNKVKNPASYATLKAKFLNSAGQNKKKVKKKNKPVKKEKEDPN